MLQKKCGNTMAKKKRNLPKNFYIYRNNIVYWPYEGCVNGKPKRGKRIILGPKNMPASKIYQALDQIENHKIKTLQWLLYNYIESPEFSRLGKTTRHNRKEIYLPRITNAVSKKTGNQLGEIPLINISPSMLMRFLETVDGNPTRNQIKTFISSAWRWAVLKYEDVPRNNPAREVPKFEAPPRKRYVTDEEYRKARRTMQTFYKAAVEIAYQCRAREIEIFALTYDDLLEEGIYINRAKGSIPEITLWNRRLNVAVAMAKFVCKNPKSQYLFHEPDGSKIVPQKFAARFKDCMRRRVAAKKLTPKERFTFHDLKAKGVSDHEGNYSGHRTKTGKKIYIRKAPKIKGTR